MDFVTGLAYTTTAKGYQHMAQGRDADTEENATGGDRCASSSNKNPRPTGRDTGLLFK